MAQRKQGTRYETSTGDRFGDRFVEAVRALGEINVGPYMARNLILDYGLARVRKWTGQAKAAVGRGDVAPEPKALVAIWLRRKLGDPPMTEPTDRNYEPGPLTRRVLGMRYVERYSSTPTTMTLRRAVEIVSLCDRELLEHCLDWVGGDILWDDAVEALATLTDIKRYRRATTSVPPRTEPARADSSARAENTALVGTSA